MDLSDNRLEDQKMLDEMEMQKAFARLGGSIGVEVDSPLYVPDAEQATRAICQCLKHYKVSPGTVPDGELSVEERINYLCRPSGTFVRKVVLDGTWYRTSWGAMLGQLDSGDMVALIPHGVGGYRYEDPSSGKMVRISAARAAGIKPDAWLFYKPFPAGSMDTGDLISYMIGSIDKGDVSVLIMSAVAATLTGLMPAVVYQVAYGVVAPSRETRWMAPLLALFLGVSLSGLLFNACRDLVFNRLSQKMKVCTEAAGFSRMLSLPLPFFKKYSSGDLATRMSQIPVITEQLSAVGFGAGLTLLLGTVYLIQIAFICAPLAWIGFAVLFIQVAVILVSIWITLPYEKAAVNEQTKLSGFVSAELAGMQKVKLSGAEKRFFARWAEYYSEYAKARYKRPIILRALPALITGIGMLGIAAMYYTAGTLGLEPARFMAFHVAYGMVTAAALEAANMAVRFVRIAPLLKMIQPILKEHPEVEEDKPYVSNLNGEIRMQNVWFRFGRDAPYLFKGLSLRISPGEYVALVGRSGCGKSTLINLLLGFETPERGVINIGQYDISKVDINSLRRTMISIVLQDSALFSGTIESNITIASPDATTEDAWEAARLAAIDDEIRGWQMGMHTVVTEGEGSYSTLSGGQKQRILLARSFCSKRKIFILDEATSALDNETQRKVVASLSKLPCTKLVVAHRLSTIRDCDRILVLDEGVIAEEGTYDELIKKNGIFTKLVERQRLE